MKSLLYPPAKAFVCFQHFPGNDPGVVYLAGLGLAATGLYTRAIAGSGLAAQAAVLPDFLGCGFSDRPEDFGYTIEEHAEVVAWLLDQLGRTQCTVIGHSMGGAVAIMLADMRPDLVQRLVLAESNLDAGGGFASRSVTSASEQEYVATGHAELLDATRRRITAENGSFVPLGMWQVAAPHALHRSAASLVAGMQPSWRERLYALTMPRLFLFGEHSLPDEDLDVLPVHGIETAVVPQAGHGMMIENPDGFASAILAFAAR
jgi:pimeloyl-ACP methyl ester carboxylesterase